MIDYLAKRPTVVMDTECYHNLWAIGFRDVTHATVRVIHMRPEGTLDRTRIAKIFRNFRVISFNGLGYDLPMISLAMTGASCSELKRASDEIIMAGLKPWQFYEKYGCQMPDFTDHIDLMEMSPGAAQRFGLKKYAGTMHSKRMQELPYPPDTWLEEDQVENVLEYLGNDLQVTQDLYEEMAPQLQLRAELSAKYGVDFRSKSDAQCGEAVMKLLVERASGKRIYRPDIKPGLFNYTAPKYVEFQTPQLQQVLSDILRSPFRIRHDGYVLMPDVLADRDITIGNGVYRMGIGGLHSSEKSISHYSDDDYLLCDNDVTSYYPNLMLRSGREPANMRGYFRPIFQDLVTTRVQAKAAGDKSTAESLKIFINGLFGKTGSPYSIVYSPEMMIQTTITGQLSILMLIEASELAGFEVISANTDGFVTKVARDRYMEHRAIVFDWECTTGLDTEQTKYISVHSRDVNNYVAFYHGKDGKVQVKRKGAYAPSGRGIPAAFGLKKSPDMDICAEAAIAYLQDGTPVESTVRNCQDIRKFVVVRKVNGGAEKNGEPIGKNVRYYLADDNPGPLIYSNNGNRVPNSDGAEPCMELPDELPRNIDYELYEREAYAILDDMGVEVLDPTLRGRKGLVLARLEEQKTIHTVDSSTGIALCGLKRKSRRDLWVEYAVIPEGHRHCTKCQKADI